MKDWDAIRHQLETAAASHETTLSDEEAHRIMDDRARHLARPLAVEAAARIDTEALVFALGRERFAISTHYVREVTPLVHYTPVPGLPKHFLGVTNLQGEILALVDLRHMFNVAAHGLVDLKHIVVLGEDRNEVGVLAFEVQEIRGFSRDELREPPASLAESDRRAVRGVTADALIVLDGRTLLDDPRLFVDQGEDMERQRGQG